MSGRKYPQVFPSLYNGYSGWMVRWLEPPIQDYQGNSRICRQWFDNKTDAQALYEEKLQQRKDAESCDD